MTSTLDDARVHPVERLWRECGLPEYFLGNGGTNTKLYALYDAIRAAPVPQCGALEDAIKPHLHVPDLETMGDCRVCGHPRKSPWHIAAPSSRFDAETNDPFNRKQVEAVCRAVCQVEGVDPDDDVYGDGCDPQWSRYANAVAAALSPDHGTVAVASAEGNTP